jgi:hypothetical protein
MKRSQKQKNKEKRKEAKSDNKSSPFVYAGSSHPNTLTINASVVRQNNDLY